MIPLDVTFSLINEPDTVATDIVADMEWDYYVLGDATDVQTDAYFSGEMTVNDTVERINLTRKQSSSGIKASSASSFFQNIKGGSSSDFFQKFRPYETTGIQNYWQDLYSFFWFIGDLPAILDSVPDPRTGGDFFNLDGDRTGGKFGFIDELVDAPTNFDVDSGYAEAVATWDNTSLPEATTKTVVELQNITTGGDYEVITEVDYPLDTYTFTGLTNQYIYAARVRTKTSDGKYSEYATPVSFIPTSALETYSPSLTLGYGYEFQDIILSSLERTYSPTLPIAFNHAWQEVLINSMVSASASKSYAVHTQRVINRVSGLMFNHGFTQTPSFSSSNNPLGYGLEAAVDKIYFNIYASRYQSSLTTGDYNALIAMLDDCLANGKSLVLRFVFLFNPSDSYTIPTDIEAMASLVTQCVTIANSYAGIISEFDVGFNGAYGEQFKARVSGPTFTTGIERYYGHYRIIKAILDNIAPGIPVTSRYQYLIWTGTDKTIGTSTPGQIWDNGILCNGFKTTYTSLANRYRTAADMLSQYTDALLNGGVNASMNGTTTPDPGTPGSVTWLAQRAFIKNSNYGGPWTGEPNSPWATSPQDTIANVLAYFEEYCMANVNYYSEVFTFSQWARTKSQHTEIERRVGSQLQITNIDISFDSQVNVDIDWWNEGYSGVHKPFEFHLIMKSSGNPDIDIPLLTNPYPSNTFASYDDTNDFRRTIPYKHGAMSSSYVADLPVGLDGVTNYDLYLWIPPTHSLVRTNAKYAYKLGNTSGTPITFNTSTGLNDLGLSITV